MPTYRGYSLVSAAGCRDTTLVNAQVIQPTNMGLTHILSQPQVLSRVNNSEYGVAKIRTSELWHLDKMKKKLHISKVQLSFGKQP